MNGAAIVSKKYFYFKCFKEWFVNTYLLLKVKIVIIALLVHYQLFNRPGVAGAVLQTPTTLIKSAIQWRFVEIY